MILPSDTECQRVLKTLDGEPALDEFEASFVESNLHRLEFTVRQREIIAELKDKYET